MSRAQVSWVPAAAASAATIEAIVAAGDADLEGGLVAIDAPPNPIHTRIRDRRAHRYNHSFYYALALCERSRHRDAEAVLGRALVDQDTDPSSPTYGLWSYYAEEPLTQMSPPDWNQADFNGRVLALVLLRHRGTLSASSRAACEEGLRHAAASIVRRDIGMDYTNIAAKGMFVVMAAGRLLDDAELTRFGSARLRRLSARVDVTGTFAEFASPTYWLITAEALQCALEYAVTEEDRDLLAALRLRHLHHLAARWNASLRQMAGPMSRAYDARLEAQPGLFLYLAKALSGHAVAEGVPDYQRVPVRVSNGESVVGAILRPRMPEQLLPAFLQAPRPHLHRELVLARDDIVAASQPGIAESPEQVTSSWLEPGLSLGSINHCDTWLQRRVLLAQWGQPADADGPGTSSARLRLLLDGADWTAGSFSSVQEGRRVLWGLGIASPAGVQHLFFDTTQPDEPLPARRLSVRLDVQAAQGETWSIDGERVQARTSVPIPALVEVSGDAVMRLRIVAAVAPAQRLEVDPETGTIELVLWESPSGPLIPAALERLGVVGTFELLPADEDGAHEPATAEHPADELSATWPGSPQLELRVGTQVSTRTAHAGRHAAAADGVAPAAPRLAEDRLLR